MDDPNIQQSISPSSGVHVVLPGHFCPSNIGLIYPKTSDGRVVFFLPWLGAVIAGTTGIINNFKTFTSYFLKMYNINLFIYSYLFFNIIIDFIYCYYNKCLIKYLKIC